MSILNNQISWVNNSRVKNFTDKKFISKHPQPIIILLRDSLKALQLKILISSRVDYLPIEVRIVMISRNSTTIAQICRQACLEDRMKSIMEGIVRKDCHHGQATSKPPKIRRLTNSDLLAPGIKGNRIKTTSNKIKCSQNRQIKLHRNTTCRHHFSKTTMMQVQSKPSSKTSGHHNKTMLKLKAQQSLKLSQEIVTDLNSIELL